MVLYLWLVLYITAVAEGKCQQNYYYDGLMESCQLCSGRCNSPPAICATYCRTSSSSRNEAGENVRIILIVLFVFLGTCMVLTGILKVIRRKACKHVLLAKAQEQVSSESERGSNMTEQSEDVDGSALDVEEGLTPTHYNSNLPLPSTEEGTTVLVTTKTVQTYNCSTQYTQGVTLGVWTTAAV
ncbi:tumor necrosis factor receptor superfamily member 17 isoform X2 [Salminus brasiliensis]|uniref:tumor necrosis factor receptor superfamily member 17 isoform X2 n=1 Tax=Salminus brasiliensis TaxID=930266 RepID=UPI003B82E30A